MPSSASPAVASSPPSASSSPTLGRYADPPPPLSPCMGPDWDALFQRYQDGSSALNVEERPVLQPEGLRYEGQSSGIDEPLPEVGTLEYVKEVYRREGYLPSLKNPREEQRRQTVHRYTHSRPKKIEAIHELTELAREIFDVPAAMVNVVTDDKAVFISTSGWHEKELDPHSPPESVEATYSMCPHAMAKSADAGCFVIPDASKDWRFQRSPLVQEGAGRVGFFASSNINLPANVACGGPPALLPVGSFCLIDSKPRPALTERQQRSLKRMAQMAAKEFELAFQKERNALVERRNEWVANLFRSLLVYPSRTLSTTFEERCNLDSLARNLLTHSQSDFTFILDLRNFNFDQALLAPSAPASPVDAPENGASSPRATPRKHPRTSASSHPSRRSFSSRRDPAVHGPGSISIVDSYCGETVESGADFAEKKAEWLKRLNSPEGYEAVSAALRDYHATEKTSWAASQVRNTPLAALLPSDTSAFVAEPIFDHAGDPALYVIVASREQHFVYEDSDIRFVNGVGGILMAGMLQEKILAADQAKLAFVGQVSHELRTPIFAIAGNIDLVRQLSSPAELEKISPLLDVADSCLETLKDVLDDCLEYSKLSNQRLEGPSSSPPDAHLAPKLTRANIVKLLTDVIKSCWSKEKRHAKAMDEEGQMEKEEVAVILESHIPPELEGMLDVGGLKRVGVNLLGNALKFTSRGSIRLRLTDATPSFPTSSSTSRYIRFESIDSGKGMSQEFIRDALFTPFKQADPFAPGAGLGVSLAAQLVARMGGKMSFSSDVGVGTTATVVIPVEVVSSLSSTTPLPFIHNFSDEFHHLACGRGSLGASCIASPAQTPSSPTVSLPPAPLDALSTEDRNRTESFAVGSVEALSNATSSTGSAKQSNRTHSALDGPLEDRAGGGLVKVLVVDDNPLARRILCAFLKSKNITFTEASGGAQAIELFKSFRPNLVWCDIQMPDVDGVTATREMRHFEEEEGLDPARIVAISGLDANHGQHSDLVESGQVDLWIVKGASSLRTLTTDMLDYADRLSSASSPSSSPPSPHRAPSSAASPLNVDDLAAHLSKLKQ